MHPSLPRAPLRDESSVDSAFRYFGSALLSSSAARAEANGTSEPNGTDEQAFRQTNSINDVRALFDGPSGPPSASPAPQRMDAFGHPSTAAFRPQQISATAPLPAMPFAPSWGSPMGSPMQQLGGFGFPRQIVRRCLFLC